MEQQYLSVKSLTAYLKRKFDVDPYLQKVYVVGEVSNFRMRPNTHQYFNLKDESARISAVIYKSLFNKIPFQLEEGMKVLAVGRITLYEPTGQYQLTIESIQPDGVGALYQAFAQLKEKFQKAGLFEQLQRPLVKYPKKIAVITSPTGAVIRDILTTIKRRYPIVQVTVYPVRVQGKESAGEIVAAFEQIREHASQYDTVILARGGGSIEDLWSFNEEVVAHAILKCPIPVISSIGHETDTTIADLVADLRAPTPTAAAELSVPVLSEIFANLAKQNERLIYGLNAQLTAKNKRLTTVLQSYILKQPERLYQAYEQQLDHLSQKLIVMQKQLLANKRHQVTVLVQKVANASPKYALTQYQQQVMALSNRQDKAMQRLYFTKESSFKQLLSKLDALSPLSSLARGYSVVSVDDKVVTSISDVALNQKIAIQVTDGTIDATVIKIKSKE